MPYRTAVTLHSSVIGDELLSEFYCNVDMNWIGFESTPTRMHVQKFKFIEPFKAVSLILSPPAGTGGMDLLVSIQNCTTSTGTLLQVMQQSENWRHTQILSNRIQVDFTVKRWISMHLSNDNTSKMVFERTVFHNMTDERCFLNAIIVTFIVLSHGSYLRSVILKLLKVILLTACWIVRKAEDW